jgi:hypothetical protein
MEDILQNEHEICRFTSLHIKRSVVVMKQAREGIIAMYAFRHKFTASPYLGLASCLKAMIIK